MYCVGGGRHANLAMVNPSDTTITGFILAGGASQRMGRDKAALLYHGRSFVAHTAAALRTLTPNVCIVGARPPHDASTLSYLPDFYAKWGALGGLHAALAACRTPWAAVIACDLPLVSGALWQHLAGLRETFDAVAPVQENGYPQALCALYRTAPALACAEQLIAAGERRARVLLHAVRTRWVTPEEISALPAAAHLLTNVNTPDEYHSLKGMRDKG